ncbi:MAG: tetrahydrofolate dehydrogenase/cyclohydrolase catalytic domain-containing protein [Actinomycetaceae bacterium]|nr:tetrahydrofolate dehydrogenase/cyclohydrolase catalytic domain-containing protein [Actinomycetaceae bacterium]
MRYPWEGAAIAMDGAAFAAEIKRDLAAQVATMPLPPTLATVLVGTDPASQKYVAGKHADCKEVGIKSRRIEMDAASSEKEILDVVNTLNENPEITGFIVQLPLPGHINAARILEAIDPAKDADGLHPLNLGRLAQSMRGDLTTLLPCTPVGIIRLGRKYGVNFHGAHVTVVGQGTTVGRPLGLLLTHESVGATVTCCHEYTTDLGKHVRDADIIVSATGVPGLITSDIVKPGAVVFDVGVARETLPSGKSRIRGDIADGVDKIAGLLTPNPGGVGPMTRVQLLANIMQSATEERFA